MMMTFLNTVRTYLRTARNARPLCRPARYQSLTVQVPSFETLEDVETSTPTNVMDMLLPVLTAPTTGKPKRVVRPERFRSLTVIVPSDYEKANLPDLPALAFQVYPELPTSSDWGATGRMALRRLEHLRKVDHVAYKTSVARGVKTPLPPKMRV